MTAEALTPVAIDYKVMIHPADHLALMDRLPPLPNTHKNPFVAEDIFDNGSSHTPDRSSGNNFHGTNPISSSPSEIDHLSRQSKIELPPIGESRIVPVQVPNFDNEMVNSEIVIEHPSAGEYKVSFPELLLDDREFCREAINTIDYREVSACSTANIQDKTITFLSETREGVEYFSLYARGLVEVGTADATLKLLIENLSMPTTNQDNLTAPERVAVYGGAAVLSGIAFYLSLYINSRLAFWRIAKQWFREANVPERGKFKKFLRSTTNRLAPGKNVIHHTNIRKNLRERLSEAKHTRMGRRGK